MVAEGAYAAGFISSLLAALVATPVAMRTAAQLGFYDSPTGWKTHTTPTPYLGGLAVVVALLVGVVVAGAHEGDVVLVAALAVGMWLVGTIDDRRSVGWLIRVVVEVAAGVALWLAGMGWSLFSADALNLALTVIWVVALVNAMNLLDLMDGVASSVAAASAAGAGAVALLQDDPLVAAVAFSLCGACLGFLPYNLRRPARIFLGDGGSMPIGFVVAAVTMAIPEGSEGAWPVFLSAGILLGIPLLDMAFRVLSRLRRGVSLLQGGQDSVASYLYQSVGSARIVAGALGAVQALLCLTALGALAAGRVPVVAAWIAWFLFGTTVVMLLEVRVWPPVAAATEAPPASRRGGRGLPSLLPVEAGAIAFFVLSCGLSPFLFGFYDLSVWGPIALLLAAVLLGLVIARPAVPSRAARVALAGLLGLWLWSLASTRWAESASQAMTEANRWMLYAMAFAMLVWLLREDRVTRVLIASAAAVTAALGVYLALRMAVGEGSSLFRFGRLHEPLGYINGQAGYLALGVWPLIAVAERTDRRLLAATGMGGAVLLTGLVVLSQTRAVLAAAVLSAIVLLAVVPGRSVRLLALVILVAAVAACMAPLLQVYADTPRAELPDPDVTQRAGLSLLVAAAAASLVWGIGGSVLARVRPDRLRRLHPGRILTTAACAGALVVGALGVVAAPDAISWVEREYDSFVDLRPANEGASRFSAAGGNRYDYWRVAVRQFSDDPLRGIGAGNYVSTYFLERRSQEDVRQAHSIEFQILGELGLVGTAALVLVLAGILCGFRRRAGAARERSADRTISVAAGGGFFVWLFHTSVDWLHLIPGVTGLALAFAAALVGPWSSAHAPRRSSLRRGALTAAALLIVFGSVLVGRAALAERYRDDARELVARAPASALERIEESLAYDDETLTSYYLQAAAYARLDRYREARAALLEATRREPHDFVSWALIGDLALRRGEVAAAARAYGEASRLNPRDELLRRLARDPASARQ